jgi:hypothetical protein
MGWPGSVSDVTIWKSSDIWARRNLYFPGDYHVLADKGA